MLADATLEIQREPWFILHVLSNREKVVTSHLAGRGVEHYLPTCKVARTRSDRKVTLELPLFPGYVFSRFTRNQQLAVVTVPGIQRIIEVPGGLARVSDGEIQALRDGLMARLLILPSKPYESGDKVRIARGPFQGTEAFVSESMNRFVRVVLSIGNIKSCSFSLDVDSADLELMSDLRHFESY
jgi:transcriptional antiterminator NusG